MTQYAFEAFVDQRIFHSHHRGLSDIVIMFNWNLYCKFASFFSSLGEIVKSLEF